MMSVEKKGPGRPSLPDERKSLQKSVYLWPETVELLLKEQGDLSNQSINLQLLRGQNQKKDRKARKDEEKSEK